MPSVDAAPPMDAAVDSPRPDGGIADFDGGAADAAGILTARPYTLHVPTSYQASQPAPLVIMFHGYGASGFLEDTYLDFTATSDSNGFLYAYGDGTLDSTNSRFWNATNGCCDLDGILVDDVQYFDVILADVQAKYNVDPKRIFVIGHSNGGFMSHRLACDRASTVAAILSLEGAQWDDLGNCTPSAPVSVVEIHGTADTTIPYDGGATTEGPYPTAPTTVADWAQRNGCTGAIAANGQTYDLVSTLAGNETTVQAYAGCPTGNDVQLWVVDGGVHIPTLSAGFGAAVWGFLSTHPKP
jgi:polyhydroxybutyrate depolymerase